MWSKRKGASRADRGSLEARTDGALTVYLNAVRGEIERHIEERHRELKKIAGATPSGMRTALEAYAEGELAVQVVKPAKDFLRSLPMEGEVFSVKDATRAFASSAENAISRLGKA